MLGSYIFTYALIGAIWIGLALFAYLANPKAYLNRTFAVYCLSIGWWSLFSLPAILTKNSQVAVWFCRLFIIGPIFIPTFFLHFNLIFLNLDEKLNKILKISYAISTFFLLTNTSSFFISSATPRFSLYNYTDAGLFFHFHFLHFFIVVSLTLWLICLNHKYSPNLSASRRKQLDYLRWMALLGYAGGAPNYLLVYHIEVPLLMPFGNFLVTFYGMATAYAIVKDRFLDIEVIVRRTAVFTGLFAFVYGTFTLITVIGQEFFRTSLGWNQWMAMVPTVLIITFTLRPLEVFLTNTTERFLFQKKYDYRQLLRTFSNEILTILDLQKLLDQTVLQLIKIMKLDCASVLLHQKNEKSYTLVATAGIKEKDVVFLEDDLLISMLREGHNPIQKDKASESVDGDGRLKNEFKRIRAQLCLPIMLHDELIGILALGVKKSGGDYTSEDIDILSTLTRTEAIAISNAQLFDELSKTQAEAAQREKMAVIGTLAAGINHEICNPLGIVRGQCEMFLLNMRDGLYADKTPDQLIQISSDIMAKVIKETDRATGITKKLSSFAKPSKKNESEDVSVKIEIDEILGLLGHDLRLSNIEFRLNVPADFPEIFVDKKQFQEVLFNIIRNAAQAMDKKSGYIAVDSHTENGMGVIKISDNGSGIPRDKINQIFNPFYTTKAPGKGTGLGLFIVKQVVERNKGTIEVESVEGEGTTFVLRFPQSVKLAAA